MQLYGRYVPPGTEIGANPYVIHRDKGVFGNDADLFRPERWLDDPANAQEMEKYILTWGYGPRICLGKNIALLETYKLLLQASWLPCSLLVVSFIHSLDIPLLLSFHLHTNNSHDKVLPYVQADHR